MPWYELTYVQCSVLTAEKMTRLQGNLAALAAQDSGAPLIGFPNSPTPALQAVGTSSVQALHVASGVAAPCVSSLAAIQVGSGIAAPQVSSFGTVQVGSGVLAPQVSSFGTVHVGSALVVAAGAARALPRGHVSGLVPANNGTDAAHDIDVSAGAARDDTDAADLRLASALTKRIDASWAVGTDQGGLDGTESVAGTPDANTWYHLWLIKRSDTGGVDVLFSESATAPNLPAGYDLKRRIGAVRTDATPAVVAFKAFEQAGGGVRFLWATPIQDWSTTTLGAADTTRTLSVPPGIGDLRVLFSARAYNSAGSLHYVYIRHPATASVSASLSAFTIVTRNQTGEDQSGSRMEAEADTNAQVVIRADAASTNFVFNTLGWIDERR